MSVRKIIILLISIAIIAIAALSIKLLLNGISNILPESVNNDSNFNYSYDKIKIKFTGNDPGIYIKDFLLTKENEKDSIFYSEKLAVRIKKGLFSQKENINLIFIKPQLHIYQGGESFNDSLAQSETEIRPAAFPEILISDLSLNIHNKDTCIRINNIDARIKPVDKKLRAEIKSSLNTEYRFHIGSDIFWKKDSISFTNGFLKINDAAFSNFQISTSEEAEAKTTRWNFAVDKADLSVLSNDSIDYNGYITYHSEGIKKDSVLSTRTQLDIKGSGISEHGKIDSLVLTHKNHFSTSTKDKLFYFDLNSNLKSDESYYDLKINYSDNDSSCSFTTELDADLDAEKINLWTEHIRGFIVSDYHAKYNSNTEKISINGKGNAQIESSQKNGNKAYIHSNASSSGFIFDYKKEQDLRLNIGINDFFSSICNQGNFTIIAELYQSVLKLPESNGSKSISPQSIGNNEDFKIPENLPIIQFRWLVDSIISGKTTLAVKTESEIKLQDKDISLNINSIINGNITGPISINFENGEDSTYKGKLYSSGMIIKDQSKIPMISNNLKLPKAESKIKAFDIPCTYKDDSLQIEASSLRTDNFIIHLSGLVNEGNSSFNIGITASSKIFKGAAALILRKNKKESSDKVETIILRVKRKDGKWDIKTDVASKD